MLFEGLALGEVIIAINCFKQKDKWINWHYLIVK